MKIDDSALMIKIDSIKDFFKMEASSGIVLGIAAILAFVVANTGFSEAYFSFLKLNVFGLTIKYWINDGLMAIFFFMVGLEIKRELKLGHLSSPKKAALPFAAALGGMLIPAIIYSFLNPSGTAASGWGIPMATDIAFAIGVLALLGKRIPMSLKVFLLAVAIVDDLGAILVIAFFYTAEIKGAGLGIAAVAFGIATLLKYSGVRSYLVYTVVGVFVWAGFLYSGIHATIAGVLLGILTPTHYPSEHPEKETYSPLDELLHYIHPWVSFGIMPIFAFANAGINLKGVEIMSVLGSPITMGIVFGLLFGKPIGVFLLSFLAVKVGKVKLPEGMNFANITGVGFLAGIGFTMSLFISGLALPTELEVYSKTGIVTGSIIAGLIGAALLYFSPNPKKSS